MKDISNHAVYQITVQFEIFLSERHLQNHTSSNWTSFTLNVLNDIRYLSNIDFKDQIQNSHKMVYLILGHPVIFSMNSFRWRKFLLTWSIFKIKSKFFFLMVTDGPIIKNIGQHFMQGVKLGPQRTSNVWSIWPPPPKKLWTQNSPWEKKG